MTDGKGDIHGDGDPAVQHRGGRRSAGPTEWVERRLPRVETGRGPDRDALALTVGLLVGLVAFVPAFGAVVDRLALPVPVPLLVGVALVGAAYAAAVVALRRWVVGTVVALVVLSTFKANVPALAVAAQFPKDVVGDVLLVHLPLALLAALALSRGWFRRSRELPVVLLAGFVAATLVPTLLGRPPSPLAAVSFTLFAFLGALAFLACVRTVADGLLRFRTLVASMLLTVGAHAAVGLVQFANQRPLGLTRLGEGGSVRPATIALPVLGDVYVGTFVSGFTGMSFVLSYLVVLVLPAGLVLAARRDGVWRYLCGAGLVGLVVVLRGSSSDAARGALLVALATLAALLAVQYRGRIAAALRQLAAGRAKRVRQAAGGVAFALLGLVVVGFPSTASGHSSRLAGGDEGGGGGSDAGGGATGGGDGAAGGGTASGTGSSAGGDTGSGGGLDVGELSVPLFDLSNLGVRLQQYVVALDLFVQFPLFGLGGMNYVLVAGGYGIAPPPGQSFPQPIHSLYFTLLAETGAVGTALYLGAVLAVLYVGWRLLGRDGVDTPLVAAALAGLVGTLAFAAFDMLALYAGPGFFPFWVVAGALLGEASRHDLVPSPV